MDRLTEFLRRAAAAPFAYGEWDCAMTLANWVAEQTGTDPAPALRRSYDTAFGWGRIVVEAGGLLQLVGDLATMAGMRAVEVPRLGDIGVVETIIGPAGAIRGRRGWIVKVTNGLTCGDAMTLGAWGF